jgi:uncharacterized protein YaiI (UPF0178 family)
MDKKNQIWVDADACPKVIKEILYRAAKRTKILTVFVANQPLSTPLSPFIQKMLVTSGFDVADNHIIQHMTAGDLIITADIPLANAVIEKGGLALNPRGEMYTKENIKQRLSIRNLNEHLRSSGVITGGPPTIHSREIQAFANRLDQFLMQKLS